MRLISVLLLTLAGVLHAAPPALPEGDTGIAAKYPGDKGIAKDPDVIFHTDFDSGELLQTWSQVMHERSIRLVDDPAEAHRGRSVKMTIKKQPEEDGASLVRRLPEGHETIFVRYYSRFAPDWDQIGSSHNGLYVAAIGKGVPEFTPGTKVTGKDKFMVLLENWRGEIKTPSPGHLNIYIYHPEQRDGYGDHFFPTGIVLPYTYKKGDFGDSFVSRPDIIPELGRWYCYELMVQANTPGERDGRVAFWVDGKLAADFHNLRLRDTPDLKINTMSLGLHIKNNPTQDNSKSYDDVVIARSYIGPIKD